MNSSSLGVRESPLSSFTPDSKSQHFDSTMFPPCDYIVSVQLNQHITESLTTVYLVPDCDQIWHTTRPRSILEQLHDIHNALKIKLSLVYFAVKLVERSAQRLQHDHANGRHEFANGSRIPGTLDDMIHFYLACLVISTEGIFLDRKSKKKGEPVVVPDNPILARVNALIVQFYSPERVQEKTQLIHKLLGSRVNVTCRSINRWMRQNRGLCLS
ncbi:hypothetical protein H4R33_000752 [Dimargaris cristalligena]|uniref:Uncharacterized protein n=1 Tax=Dimargaris cristalligena TaxID=215637 RepID=A0A4P9ZXZ2_9FUNG|nr:hypothetical protein H4R33_000752 [Dimargaris cristalligena]RKP38564.1 hypothetical protein BJ085DRAFT_27562 [Dimargaris cristalligena]|eukprot:RKP38564.1 hypothetical protein BJ085DRAFT_27562 [Dimargaris cristalligena]